MPRYSRIVTTGRFVPENRQPNADIESRCDLELGWIKQRTGIDSRPIASANHAVSDLAALAGSVALDRFRDPNNQLRTVSGANANGNGLERGRTVDEMEISASENSSDIGMLILATSTPDFLLPPTAPAVAHQLGLGSVPAFDIAVACSGFLYALHLADHFCKVESKSVLVIAANVLSRRVSPMDPSSAAIFADGAGAVVVSPSDKAGIISIKLESDGAGASYLKIPDGGSRVPFNEHTFANGRHVMQVENGMAVYRYAVESMAKLGQEVMKDAQLGLPDVDFWIPHQANRRIIESVQSRLKISDEKVGITIDQYANSSAATIPIALDYFIENEKVERGDRILLTAAAAGLTSGAAVLKL